MKWTLLCCIVLLFTSSCNKFLDVNPAGELPAEKLLKDAAGFENAMYGVYATMPKGSLYGASLSNDMVEVLAQSFESFGNNYVFNLQTYNYKFSSVEAELLNTWKDMYNNISNVNNVLKNLNNFSPQTLKYYDLYKGEALGLRAFMHFDLLRLYTEHKAGAEGIPYSKSFSLTPPDFSTAAQNYTQIITDLKEAENLLKQDQAYFTFPKVNPAEGFVKDREIHFNLYAVQATLARVYFTQGDLPNALIYAEKVIQSGKFQLLDKAEVASGVMKGILYPKETIFGLYSNNYFTTAKSRFYLETSFYSYNPRKNTKAIYEKNQVGHDYRWDAFFKLPLVPSGNIRFVKLVDPYQLEDREFQRPAQYIKGINMIRLPEMYYIAAEALLNSNPQKAREYFDKVLESRGLIGLANQVPAQSLTLNLITEDRYKEFIGEGQNFFNMKRLHLDITDVYQKVIPASKEVYVLPVPLEETDYRK
ncbi:MAG: RagB/SusD family nutrient uptake outer membrane protein [Ginsengibacter sp.]